MKTIALIASGNYHRIWLPVAEDLAKKGFVIEFYCMNYKSYDFLRQKFSANVYYLYQDVNSIFRNVDIEKDKDWLFSSLLTDKNHYKRKSGEYQERIAVTFGKVVDAWIYESQAESFFFPIIESIQCDIFYTKLLKKDKKVFVHTHLRHLDRSFWSNDKLESLPKCFDTLVPSGISVNRAKEFIIGYRNDARMLSYEHQSFMHDINDIYVESWVEDSAILRFIKNVKLSYTIEKHNHLYNPVTKLKVSLQRIIVPINRVIYSLFETFYLKPLDRLPAHFAYFPLQFSPESSINTPNPEYIDQIVCVEEILRRTEGYRPLVIKEHPAMFLKRSLSFYRRLKRMPYVFFVSKDFDSIELLSKADCTYTVTGTVSMEAYILGHRIQLLGNNFLKHAIEEGISVEVYFSKLFEISLPFNLYSPPSKDLKDRRYKSLFSIENIKNISISIANIC